MHSFAVMEEVSSNMIKLKAKITDQEECADSKMPDNTESVEEEIKSTQRTQAAPVKLQLEEKLQTTLKSLQKDWCERTKQERAKYNELLGKHINVQERYEQKSTENKNVHEELAILKTDYQSLILEMQCLRPERDKSKQGKQLFSFIPDKHLLLRKTHRLENWFCALHVVSSSDGVLSFKFSSVWT